MVDESYLVPPVERNLMPLKVRRVGARGERRNEKSPYEQQASGHKHEDTPPSPPKEPVLNILKSENKIDCKI
jgi:hypothetical protein